MHVSQQKSHCSSHTVHTVVEIYRAKYPRKIFINFIPKQSKDTQIFFFKWQLHEDSAGLPVHSDTFSLDSSGMAVLESCQISHKLLKLRRNMPMFCFLQFLEIQQDFSKKMIFSSIIIFIVGQKTLENAPVCIVL